MGNTHTKITKVIFKLNAGLKESDNFEHGASGNMLAAVDIQSGKICRTISGVGLNQVEILQHPNTGAKLLGFEIPNWTDVVRLVNDSQKAFPGFLCPGWDIALCDDGPKILEVNAFGDIDLSQHAYRSGFFDEDFIACMRDRGLAELLNKSRGSGSRSKSNNRIGLKKHHWQW
jgi:Sugar-transfer associated ATP-grasp